MSVATSPRPAPGAIPDQPGVYLFKDAAGRVIYVGKAGSLRKRTANYFQPTRNLHPRTAAMVEASATLEWLVVRNEVEALQLEYTLIKQHRPRYNVRYRDDKSYPWLAVTLDEDYPRARVQRGPKRKGVRYFGPYTHAYAIRETLDLLLRTFPLRTCSQGVFDRAKRSGRPCILYDIHKCSGPCAGKITAEGHRGIVEDFVAFMDGNTRATLERLESEMRSAAAALNFEAAARLRDQLASVRTAMEKQQMVSSTPDDFDIAAFAEDDLEAAVQVFFVRRGRVVGRRGFVVDKVEALDTAGLAATFVQQLYGEQGEEPPREVLLPVEPADADTLKAWLASRRGGPVDFRVPRRGEKRALLETVERNAKEAFVRHKLERASDFDARAKALQELQDHLDLPAAPLRIECYDISNLQADHIVASMVVFEDGLPRKSEYRRFEIRTLTGQDDFAAMREVITRRLARLRTDREEQEDPAKRRFAYTPNLIVIDGGRGQLGAALEAVEASGTPDLPVVSLAKRMEEVYIPGQPEPIVIPRSSEALYLLQRVRDEAHRFAVTYHRKLRGKAMTKSRLDAIPGIGEHRRKQLIRHFGSVKRVREATLDELKAVPGLGETLAETVYRHLHGGAAPPPAAEPPAPEAAEAPEAPGERLPEGART